jgi:hypothetical protein
VGSVVGSGAGFLVVVFQLGEEKYGEAELVHPKESRPKRMVNITFYVLSFLRR